MTTYKPGPKSKRKNNFHEKTSELPPPSIEEGPFTRENNEIEFVILSEETVNSLSCPVCFETPKSDDPSDNKVCQCENGHTVCADCHEKMTDKNCPQCRMSMFKTRFTNFVSENFLPKLSKMATNEPEVVPLSEETVDSLKCPKCLVIPGVNQIYQCENGHTICFQCYSHKNCQECQLPMKKTRFTNFVSENVLPKLSIQCPFVECPKKKNWSEIEKHKRKCQYRVKRPSKIVYKCTICKKDHYRSMREFTYHTMKSHAKLGKKELHRLINRATLPPSKQI